MNKEPFLDQAINWARSKGYNNSLKVSNAEGYEEPKSFLNKTTNTEVIPDMTFVTASGGKHYTEIALKSDQAQDLVTKWKFLAVMASMKQGKLHLLAPRGHKSFVTTLVDKYNIDAIIHSV
ncbi:MAG: hypothetical protein AAFV80_22455 [Bacteroidota bacterium]